MVKTPPPSPLPSVAVNGGGESKGVWFKVTCTDERARCIMPLHYASYKDAASLVHTDKSKLFLICNQVRISLNCPQLDSPSKRSRLRGGVI